MLSRNSRGAALSELFLALLPKLTRADLESTCPSKGAYIEVEPAYSFRLRVPLNETSKNRFIQHCGTRRVAPFFAVCLEDVRLIGPFGIPVTRSGKVVVEAVGVDYFGDRIFRTIRSLGKLEAFKQYVLAILPILERRANTVSLAAHMLPRELDPNGHAHFGHWVGEKLPQLRAYRALSDSQNRKIPVLLNAVPENWQLELLGILGLQDQSIIRANPRGQRVLELGIASLRNVHSRAVEIDPRSRRWLLEEFKTARMRKTADGKQVYVLRAPHESRALANQKELSDCLQRAGFKRFTPGLQDKATEISELRSARVLVGDFGSGLMNVLFTPQIQHLVEIFAPGQRDRHVFFFLASELGIRYSSIEIDSGRSLNPDTLLEILSTPRLKG